MNELTKALVNSGIITAEDVKRLTTLELLMLIITKINELDENIKNQVLPDIVLEDIKNMVNKSIESSINQSIIPFNMSHAKGIKTFPCRDGVGQPFTQGFAINEQRDELYVSRQINGGTEVEIHIFKFSTLAKIGVKSYTKSSGAYQEGCPYFINDNGERVFLVRKNYSDKLAHFNWDTGILDETPMNVLGGSKVSIDNEGKYFITSMGDATYMEGCYIYDLESIKQRQPLLLRTIRFPLSVRNGNKTQGMTMINGMIYLSQGMANGIPSIVVLNQSGQVVNQIELDKHDLATKMEGQVLDSTEYENEGIYFIHINGVCYPVINHVFTLDTCCLMIHGNPLYGKVKEGKKLIISNELKWMDLPLESDVESYGEDVKPQYAKDENGRVYLRGVVKHTPLTPQTENILILSTLGYPYRPDRNYFFHTVASGWSDKQNRIECYKNGQIVLLDTNSRSNEPFTCLDGISFMTEQS